MPQRIESLTIGDRTGQMLVGNNGRIVDGGAAFHRANGDYFDDLLCKAMQFAFDKGVDLQSVRIHSDQRSKLTAKTWADIQEAKKRR